MMNTLVDRLFQGRVMSTIAYLGLLGIMVATLNITARNHRRGLTDAATHAVVNAHAAALHAAARALPSANATTAAIEPAAQNAAQAPAAAQAVATP